MKASFHKTPISRSAPTLAFSLVMAASLREPVAALQTSLVLVWPCAEQGRNSGTMRSQDWSPNPTGLASTDKEMPAHFLLHTEQQAARKRGQARIWISEHLDLELQLRNKSVVTLTLNSSLCVSFHCASPQLVGIS